MIYDKMTPKQKRILARDLAVLFSPKALLPQPTIEELKGTGIILRPSVKYRGRMLFLTERGSSSRKRVIELFTSRAFMRPGLLESDIAEQAIYEHRSWMDRHQEPDTKEFTDALESALLEKIKSYQFLIRLEGLDLKDLDSINVGSMKICRSDREMLQRFDFGDNPSYIKSVSKKLNGGFWITGQKTGSRDSAQEQFNRHARLAAGILGVSGAVLYKGAIWRTRVRPVISGADVGGVAACLSWVVDDAKPTFSLTGKPRQRLTLDADMVAYLQKEYLLNELSAIPDKAEPSKLEETIGRALYWFTQAYLNDEPVSQFQNLWSSVEAFFTIRDKVTESIKMGMAAVLAFGGAQIVPLEEYENFKRRIDVLYDLRGRACHEGEHAHISLPDLNDLSFWTAWIIILMTSLAQRGYTSLTQVHEQIQRLDRIKSGASA